MMTLGAVRKPVAHVFLPSPSEPLINPRASLREFAAVHLSKCASTDQPSAFASSSSARSFIAWSAKELVKIQFYVLIQLKKKGLLKFFKKKVTLETILLELLRLGTKS